MKKVLIAVAVVVVALIAAGAHAWDVPSSVPTSGKDVMDTAGKMGSKMGIDKVLKDAKCSFQKDSKNMTCDVSDLKNKLAAIIKGTKEAKGWDVTINIQADNSKNKKNAITSYDRGYAVKDALQKGLQGVVTKSWNFNVNTTDKKGDGLSLSADVQ